MQCRQGITNRGRRITITVDSTEGTRLGMLCTFWSQVFKREDFSVGYTQIKATRMIREIESLSYERKLKNSAALTEQSKS